MRARPARWAAAGLGALALCAAWTAPAGATSLTWTQAGELSLPANADAGQADAVLSSVDCTGAGTCTAVGSYTDATNAGRALVASQAAGTWTPATELELPADAQPTDANADATAVACGAAGTCVLTGTYVNASGHTAAMVASQTGATWSRASHLALPANADATSPAPSLVAVACGAPGSCSAVGSYWGAGGRRVMVATQSNGTWSAASELDLPAGADPTGPDAGLYAVACAAAGSCATVGSYRDDQGAYRAMVAAQVGGTWADATELDLPSDADATDPSAYLNTVACGAAGACTALGSYTDGSGAVRAMATDRTGASWSTATTLALPADARGSDPSAFIASVSCGAADTCGAVGSYADSNGTLRPMVAAREHGAWSGATRLALPADAHPTAPDASLSAVDCGAAGACAAAGSYVDAAGALRPMAASQTGAAWSTAAPLALAGNADPANPDGVVTAVACGAATSCALVGHYTATTGGRRAMAASARQEDAPPGATPPPSPVATPRSTPAPVASPRPLATLKSTRLVVSKGAIKLKLACRRARCAGVIKLTRRTKGRTVVLATASYSIASGTTRTIALRLTKAGRKTFAHRPTKVSLVVGVNNAKAVTKTVVVR